MGFMRYANAMVAQPQVSQRGWGKVRRASASPDRNIMAQAAEILGGVFDPDKYLLTHSTLVASVDVEHVPNVKLGRVKVGNNGRTINRKYANYHIKPECNRFVNNNGDSWSRQVLLASYQTLIGAHNFLEHVQLEEQSKGRIIDAVARDIGDSVYVDILMATDRRHSMLIKDIESNKISTLSMGCFLPGTMVTMADGTRVPIEDVQVGDMVLTHKGRAREVLNKQIRGVENGSWNIRRIRAQGVPAEIPATDIHPFFVYRAAETCACGCAESLPDYAPPKGGLKHKHTTRKMTRRFKVGHDKRILNPNGSYSLDEHRERQARMDAIQAPKMEEVKAADLKEGDFLCFPRAEVSDATEGGVTVGLARLLGYFLAEGSFLKYKGDPVEVQFNFSMEEKDTYVAEVVESLRQEFPDAKDPWVQDRPDRNTCVVHIYGRDVAAWFFQHGGEYSHRKRMSARAMKWPVEMHKHTIGAWINGDGCLHSIHGSTSGTTTSYDLACQMHMLMARVGVYARMECTVAGRSVDVRQVVNGGLVVRDEATGKLPAFTLAAGQTDSQPLTGYSNKVISDPTFANREFRVLDDVVMFPITSIEDDTYEGWVHDMEVEEDHSYMVEGVAVHNCSVEETICTKCGNVAIDETDLCPCIKYAKLNKFLDDRTNQQRIIAELCGHTDIEENAGVHFIEASWVATPAFAGAELRNIVQLNSLPPQMADRLAAVMGELPPEWDVSKRVRAASYVVGIDPKTATFGAETQLTSQFDFGEEGEEEGGDGGGGAEEGKNPLDQITDDVEQAVVDRVKDKLEEDIRREEVEEALSPQDSSAAPNDTIIKEGYQSGVKALVRTASSDVQFVDRLASLNRAFGIQIPRRVYRTALRVGPMSQYSTPRKFLAACKHAATQPLTPVDVRSLVRIGTLLNSLSVPSQGDTP